MAKRVKTVKLRPDHMEKIPDAVEARSKSEITISEASKRGYASRATLQRAVKNGKLSISKEENGYKYIQIAELERVYGATGDTPASIQANATPQSGNKNSSLSSQLAVAQKEIELLREQANKHEAEKEKYEEREKRLLDQVEATQRMLTDQSEGRGFFKKLFGG